MLGRASVARQTGTHSIGLGVVFVVFKACRQRRCVTHTVSSLTATTRLGMLPYAPGSGFGYLTPTLIPEPGCDQPMAFSTNCTDAPYPKEFAQRSLMEDAFYRTAFPSTLLMSDSKLGMNNRGEGDSSCRP
jgi:hypothetical protein